MSDDEAEFKRPTRKIRQGTFIFVGQANWSDIEWNPKDPEQTYSAIESQISYLTGLGVKLSKEEKALIKSELIDKKRGYWAGCVVVRGVQIFMNSQQLCDGS